MTVDANSVVFCCDLGGSSLRVGLVGDDGTVIAMASAPLAIGTDTHGRSEADPAVWWDALLSAARTVAGANPAAFGSIAAVAICGMTRTQVLVDANHQPVRPAITFLDVRAREIASGIARDTGLSDIDAYHPLARLAWVANHEPEALSRAAHLLDPKDYLVLRLTGTAASDPISLARLAGLDARAAPVVARSKKLLPALFQPGEAFASVQQSLPAPLDALVGTPVVMASNDTWTAVVGLGAMRHGFAYNISGTSEVLGMIGSHPASAPGLLTVDWDNGLFQLGGPSQTGADALGWLQAILGPQTADLIAGVDAAAPHPQPLLFLPFLQGERVPHWNADLRAAFVGLDRSHGPQDLARAVLEGIAFANREVLTRAEAALGFEATEIRFGGGGARNAAWCQIKADVCARPVVTTAGDEAGLIGCAAVAYTALGRYDSLAMAQEQLVRQGSTFFPRDRQRVRYDHLFDVYQRAVAADIDLSAALAAVPRHETSDR